VHRDARGEAIRERVDVDGELQRERRLDGGTRPLERADREAAERLHERAAVLAREQADLLEEPRRDGECLAVAEIAEQRLRVVELRDEQRRLRDRHQPAGRERLVGEQLAERGGCHRARGRECMRAIAGALDAQQDLALVGVDDREQLIAGGQRRGLGALAELDDVATHAALRDDAQLVHAR